MIFRKLVGGLVAFAIAALSLVPAADARRVLITKGYSGAPYTYNINSTNTAAFRAVVAANTRNTLIAAVGDSTTAGFSTGFTTTQALTSWPVQLSNLFNTQGTTSGANNRYGAASSTWTFLLTFDGRVTGTGAWTQGATLAVGGNAFAATSAGSMTFTPQANVSKFDIYWRDGASGRNFDISIDGGAATHVLSSGTTQIAKTSVTAGGVGAHSVTLTWVLGAVTVLGINSYDATRNELSSLNWGINGATSTNLIDNTDTIAGRFAEMANSLMKPDLAIVEAGIVNDWRNSISVAQSKANVTSLVRQLLAGGSNVILLTPPFDNGSAGFTANQNAYVNELYQVAAEQGVGLIDIRLRWSSYANAVANGWQTNADTVHPTPAGYADEARVINAAIKSAINNTF